MLVDSLAKPSKLSNLEELISFICHTRSFDILLNQRHHQNPRSVSFAPCMLAYMYKQELFVCAYMCECVWLRADLLAATNLIYRLCASVGGLSPEVEISYIVCLIRHELEAMRLTVPLAPLWWPIPGTDSWKSAEKNSDGLTVSQTYSFVAFELPEGAILPCTLPNDHRGTNHWSFVGVFLLLQMSLWW